MKAKKNLGIVSGHTRKGARCSGLNKIIPKKKYLRTTGNVIEQVLEIRT
jgi:hypothetical protein